LRGKETTVPGKVVLIDLDRTLLDEEYRVGDPTVADTIKRMRNEGWQIGLTADAPLLTLLAFWNHLGMNGPVVLEKGAAAWYPEDDAVVTFTKSHSIIVKGKPAVLSAILKMENTMMVYGDSTNFVRVVHELPGVLNSTLIAFNGLRQYSIGFHIRRIEKGTGRLLLDVDLAHDVIKQLREHFPVSDLLSEGELLTEYGFFHISPTDVSKASGTLAAFEGCRAERRVVIGDSVDDIVHGGGVELLAVGNAHPELKAAASKVAGSSYATGVKELLEQL